MKQLPEFRTRISIHPKVRGELEHKLLKETKVTNVQILAAAHSTISEALQSEVIVSHQSSVGIQALFLGIPTIFFSPEGLELPLETSSIDGAEVSKVIRDGETLIRNLRQIQGSRYPRAKAYSITGIPRDSTERIMQKLRPLVCPKSNSIQPNL